MTDWLKDAVTIDYETLPAGDRPHKRPPAPVGVSIKVGSKKPHYHAWGHPTGNQPGAWAAARRELGEAYDSGRPLLFHNGLQFDVEVGEEHMGLPPLPWDRYHDTLPMLFMRDPRAPDFRLKDTAQRLLGEAPDERDAVVDWLVENQPIAGVKMSRSKDSDHYAGAYPAFVPAELAAKYANGDVDRTRGIAERTYKELVNRKMVEPYDLERRLAPHIRTMERQGLRVDVDRLARDVERYSDAMARLEHWIRRRLKASADLNLDSGPQLAKAIVACGAATIEGLGVTKTGKMQTNKDALNAAVKDPQLLAMLRYRAQLTTCLGTFMRPWLAVASASGGYMFTDWNSTRKDRGSGGAGARTGRFSSTPNFQNLPKEFKPLFRCVDQPKLPVCPIDLPPLPLIRSYVIPYADGDVLLDRDYSQQELRVLAHYEDAVLKDAYLKDPWLDVHALAQTLINNMLGTNFERKPIKNTGFGLIYGMGIGHLAETTGTDTDTAKKLKAAYLSIFPGLKTLNNEMKARAKNNEPIRTWGGREYYVEPPMMINGRFVTFDYKLLNVLIQGSSGDCTKVAMADFGERAPRDWRLLLTVHDELAISAPRKQAREAMELLRDCMESVKFDVPMLSEGSWSDRNWQELVDYDSAGKIEKSIPL